MKKILLIFLSGFLLNFVWENLHSFLYVKYQGGPITKLVLLRAAAADALIILILVWAVKNYFNLPHKAVLILIFGIIIAVVMEKFALVTGRWIYAPDMPIIPFINTGLTPTLQLGITGLIAYKFNEK